MSLGIEAAGFDLVAAVEIDPIHAASHHFNFPYAATLCKDVSQLRTSELEAALKARGVNSLDLIVGGPPCQGFSHIGKRQLDDPRNRLVFEYCRIVDHLKPKYFIFENVPGMASGKQKIFVQELVEEFDRIGYHVVAPIRILDAARYGVAEKRLRLILLGYRKDCPSISYPPPRDLPGVLQAGLFGQAMETPGAATAISDLERHEIYVGDDQGIPRTKLCYEGYRRNLGFDYQGAYALCHRRTFADELVWGHVGSRHTDASIERFTATRPGETERISRFFKLHPERPCHTLRAGTASNRGAYTAPRPIHYARPRCISIREAARLHSFPDWFQFHRTIWHGFRQIGNSVAPLFARALGLAVIEALAVPIEALPVDELPTQDDALVRFNMAKAAAHFDVPRHTIAPRQRIAATA
jgi:DNA (cytosine-5)-methyltransferase 1